MAEVATAPSALGSGAAPAAAPAAAADPAIADGATSPDETTPILMPDPAAPPPASLSRVLARKGWALGLSLIVVVAFIWVGASYVVKSVLNQGIKPFLFTYICNSLFTVYVPMFEGVYWWRSRREAAAGRAWRPIIDAATETPRPPVGASDDGSGSDEEQPALGAHSGGAPLVAPGTRGALVPPDRVKTARASLLVSPFWFLAQYTFNSSLQMTSVTSNTVLSCLASVFTFALSVACLGEKLTFEKAMSVATAAAGVVLVGLSDRREGGDDTVVGDMYCIVSAAAYAVYTLLLRVKLPESDDISMMLFFGYVGVCNALLFLPFMVGIHLSGDQELDKVPARAYQWTVLKGLVDNVLSDYIWAWGVLLTTPTVATVGLSIQIPVAMFTSIVVEGVMPGGVLLAGAALVTVGFLGVNCFSDPEKGDREREVVRRDRDREDAIVNGDQ